VVASTAGLVGVSVGARGVVGVEEDHVVVEHGVGLVALRAGGNPVAAEVGDCDRGGCGREQQGLTSGIHTQRPREGCLCMFTVGEHISKRANCSDLELLVAVHRKVMVVIIPEAA